MHAANLLKLADYLDRLPPDYAHFDMRTFGNGHPCKTSACAAGHPSGHRGMTRADLLCSAAYQIGKDFWS